MTMLQIILVVAITALVIVIGLAITLGQERARQKRVLGVIQGGAASHQKGPKKDEKDKRRADLAKKLKDAKEEDLKADGKKKTTIAMMLEQAGLSISVTQFWIFSFLLCGGVSFLAHISHQPLHIKIAIAVIGLLGIPRFVLKKITARRQKKFLQEFPDALEATVRLLRAGMPVSEAISMIAREFEGPVGEEMERIKDKQKIGVPLHEAALEATRRMPITEMQMFATGLSIQAQTGSSLSEVLTNLSNVIRSRFRLKRKVKALSSEAVASASIIAALPCLVALALYFVNYDYISLLFTDSFGNVLLTGAIVWMSIGVFVMKVMINFKI